MLHCRDSQTKGGRIQVALSTKEGDEGDEWGWCKCCYRSAVCLTTAAAAAVAAAGTTFLFPFRVRRSRAASSPPHTAVTSLSDAAITEHLHTKDWQGRHSRNDLCIVAVTSGTCEGQMSIAAGHIEPTSRPRGY